MKALSLKQWDLVNTMMANKAEPFMMHFIKSVFGSTVSDRDIKIAFTYYLNNI